MIFHGFGTGPGRPGTGPPEAPSESPEAMGDRNSARSTPGSAQEPQNTHRNILEPSRIDWSTQTDPRSEISKISKKDIYWSVCENPADSRLQLHILTRLLWRPGCLLSAAHDSTRSQLPSCPLKPSPTTPPCPRIIPRGLGTIQEPGIVLEFFWRRWKKNFSGW